MSNAAITLVGLLSIMSETSKTANARHQRRAAQRTVRCNRLLASRWRFLALHQNVPYLAGVMRHRRPPASECAVGVDSLASGGIKDEHRAVHRPLQVNQGRLRGFDPFDGFLPALGMALAGGAFLGGGSQGRKGLGDLPLHAVGLAGA